MKTILKKQQNITNTQFNNLDRILGNVEWHILGAVEVSRSETCLGHSMELIKGRSGLMQLPYRMCMSNHIIHHLMYNLMT